MAFPQNVCWLRKFDQNGGFRVKRRRACARYICRGEGGQGTARAKSRGPQFPKISVKSAAVTIWKAFESYQMVNLYGELIMSDQEAELAAANSGPLNVEGGASAASEAAPEPTASARGLASEFSFAEADRVIGAAETGAPSAVSAKSEAAASSSPNIEIDAEPVGSQASKHDAAPASGEVVVMPPRDRQFDEEATSKPDATEALFGKRRFATLAAVVALAMAAGAFGGATVTAALVHGGGEALAANDAQGALEGSLSRIDADLRALKAGLENTARLGMSQFNKTGDRLDRLERAQAEPAAKLVRLSEAVDKLHALPVPPPAVAAVAPAGSSAVKEATGSTGPAPAPQQIAATSKSDGKSDGKTDTKTDTKPEAKADTKAELGRLPTLDDWVLRNVAYGGALINGRRGVYEVYAGDYIPGLGRIDAIRRQDGRWVVVTSRGLIVAR
jgi:hypothetical protein